LLEYAFREGVDLAVLTNGLLWWLYLPLLEGSWEQRKFLTIDIQQQRPEDAAQHFSDFLEREAVTTGSAAERARALHASKEKDRLIRGTIPEVWKQLCQKPDEQLLELLADRVESLCGHRPGQDLLAEHLAGLESSREIEPPLPPSSKKGRESRRGPAGLVTDPADWTHKQPVAFALKGERHSVSTFKETLLGLSAILYRDHQSDFSRVLSLRGRKRAYFSRDLRGIKFPQEIPSTGIYAETNLSANAITDLCSDLLALFGRSRDQFKVGIHNR
jgi:hypothetical protein